MTDAFPSRRAFLASGGALAAGWLGSDPRALLAALTASREAAAGIPTPLEILTELQAADLDAMAALIIPSDDDLPGAREARVVVFIDRSLGTFAAGQKDSMLEGLDDLNGLAAERWPGAGRFAELSDERQLELLHEIEGGPFFGQVRTSVVFGTFAHPDHGGNHEGAGWELLGFEPRYVWRPPFGEYDAEEMGR